MEAPSIRVLLVTDDEADRDAFERFVAREKLSYDCAVAQSVSNAKNILASGPCDVLIASCSDGDDSIFELIEAVKDIPIVVLASRGDSETVARALQAGATDFLETDDQHNHLTLLPLKIDSAIKRKRAEQQLHLFSAAVDQSTDGIAVVNPEGHILFINRAFATIHGYTPQELVGKNLSMFHTPEQMPSVNAANQQLIETGHFDGEILHAHRDGTVFPVRMINSLLHDAKGHLVGLIGTVTDITERTRVEEAARLSDSRLEALLQLDRLADAPTRQITDFALEEAVRLTGSQIGYVGFMNEDETVFTIRSWSRTVMEQCKMIDKPFVFQMDSIGLLGESVRQRRPVITNDYAAPNPLKHGYPGGHVTVTRHLSVPVFEGERVVAMAGVGNKGEDYDDSDVRQLTLLMDGMWRLLQRQQSQQALREAHDMLERRVSERTANLQEANAALRTEIERRKILEKEVLEISAGEQQRMGQELHDGLGQTLTGLGYLAHTLYGDLQERSAEEASAADQLASGIQEALDQARSIAKGVVPVEIRADGLMSALADLAATTENRFGIPCTFNCRRPVLLDDASTADQLFRITQEAVSNAAKHSRASRIVITLVHDDSLIVIRIEDDGVGIPADLDQTNGVGLRIMHLRAAVVGATLEICPTDGAGTLVTCTLATESS